MKSLLKKTENFLNREFKIEEERFTQKVNFNDKFDEIQIDNISFASFQRRIANLVLEEIFIKEEPGCTLPQFLSQTWLSTKPQNPNTLNTPRALEAFHGDDSPPLTFSNMSIADDYFRSKRHSAEEDLDLSEIKVSDGFIPSVSTTKAHLDHVLQELRKDSSSHSGLPVIQVTKYDDPHNNFPKNMRITERKLTGPSHKLSNQVTNLVINEANESEKSESNQEFASPTLSFAGGGSALRPLSPMMASITGLGSHIKRASDSESSEEDNQRTSIFSLLNAKLAPRTFEKSKPGQMIQLKKSIIVSSSSSSEESERNFGDLGQSIESFQDSPEINPWFTLTIASKEWKFKKMFKKLAGKREIIKLANLDELFVSVLKKLKIFPYEHYKVMFKNLYQGLYPGKYLKISKRIIDPRLNFLEFVELMNLWGDKYQKERKTFLGKLVKTADRLRLVFESIGEFESLSDIVSFNLFKLSKIISDLVGSQKLEEIEDKYKKTLEEIFLFYAKLQRIQGAEPTFESVEASNSTWNLGKFLKFCNDFELILHKTEGVRATTKENLVCIFKKTAVNTRNMNFSQFLQALDKISEFLYSPDFDRQLLSRYAYKSLAEKRILLFEALEIIDFQKIKHKVKPFGLGFNPDKKSRIPKTDPSNNYRFKISPRQKHELEDFQKIPKILSLSPTVSKDKFASPQPSKRNQNFFVIEGYSNKFKSPRRINRYKSAQNDNELGIIENKHELITKPQFSQKQLSLNKFSNGINHHLSIRKSPDIMSERLTIKSLYNMNYREIEDECSLKELILNDSDQEFDKLYSLDPGLDKIAKIHDNQRARGLKVIKKNKFS